jgi:hypothetical protein
LLENDSKALTCLRKAIPEWDERIEKERMKQAVKEAPVLAEHGANQHGDKSGVGDTKSSSKGTNATYLTARLKRDAPDIATRLERGEFKSVRAAAIEAGIVNAPKTAVAPILAGFSTGPDQSPEIFFSENLGQLLLWA